MIVKLIKFKTMKRAIFQKSIISSVFAGLLFMTSVVAQDVTVKETPEFNAIEVSGIFNVFLTQAPVCLVEFETQNVDPEKIEVIVKKGVLELSYDGSLPRGGKINAKISAPYFSSIEASGAVNLQSTNTIEHEKIVVEASGATKIKLSVNTANLSSEISGASNVYYEGTATVHKIEISGASLMKADALASDVVVINASGASNIEVDAKSSLNADLSGTSKLTYVSEPESKSIAASGLSKVGSRSNGDVSYQDSKDTMRIKVAGQEVWIMDEDGKKSKKTKKNKFRKTWSGIDFGMNAYVSPIQSLGMRPEAEFLSLEHNKSWVINFNLFQKSFPIISNNVGIVTGIGFGFNNYRLADNTVTLVYNPNGIDYINEPDLRMKKNKLVLAHLNIPLLLEFQTQGPKKYNQFNLAVGGNFGVLLDSYTRQTYDIDGKTMKRKVNENFHVAPFRYEAVARIGYGGVHLFASYALNSFFKKDKGPEIYPFSVGISLTN